MTCVFVLNNCGWKKAIPSGLSHVPLKDVHFTCDTSKVYVKGRIKRRWELCKMKRTFLKVQLEEEETRDTVSVYLIEAMGEQCKDLDLDYTLAITGFTVEKSAQSGGENVDYEIIVRPDTSAIVWVQKGERMEYRAIPISIETLHPSTVISGISSSTQNKVHDVCATTTTEPDAVCKTSDYVSSNSTAAGNSSTVTKHVNDAQKKVLAKVPNVSTSSLDQNMKDSSSSSKCDKSNSSSRSYKYDALNNLKVGMTVNVYGIVKYCRPISRSRGSDYMTLISIVDSSLVGPYSKLKCMLFAKERNHLPEVQPGHLVRFHRLKILQYNNELQGQAGPGFSWLVFEPNADNLTPKTSSSASYTFGDGDKKEVRRLIEWSNTEDSLLSQDTSLQSRVDTGLITLSSVTMNKFFDLVCQIVGTCVIEANVSMLFRIWDGTKVHGLTFEQDFSDPVLRSRYTTDPELLKDAQGYLVDLWVFDEYFKQAESIKPGDFVRLTNVHAMLHKVDQVEEKILPMMELCVHGNGKRFNRGIQVIEPNSSIAKNLKSVLSECVECENSLNYHDDPLSVPDDDTDGVTDIFLSAESHLNENPTLPVLIGSPVAPGLAPTGQKRSALKANLTENHSIAEKLLNNNCDVLNIASSNQRCTVKSATVITDHHHIPVTALRDVLTTSVPNKFRVSVKVVSFSPMSSVPSDMIRLFCSKCDFVSNAASHIPSDITRSIISLGNGSRFFQHSLPAERSASGVNEDVTASTSSLSLLTPHHEDEGLGIYRCPSCEKMFGGEEHTLLSYIYMLSFHLDDGTDWLAAILCRENAVQFFHGIKPSDVLKSRAQFEEIRRRLDGLLATNFTSNKMECCLCSYRTPCGRAYQIFDTELSLDD